MNDQPTTGRHQTGWHSLSAGPVDMQLDPASGFLRYIRLLGHEVLRGIYVAVRDRNWGTVQPRISSFSLNQSETGFEIQFQARCESDEVDFAWEGRIEGLLDGTVVYSMGGKALRDFFRNRIGFCVLHPIHECTGKACAIKRSDGVTEESRFPTLIAPHQPFERIRSMTHEVTAGVSAKVSFSGDTFETEDQRNWSDASYKTYCTPLALPSPVQLTEGEVVRQKVTLRFEGLENKEQALGQAQKDSNRTVKGRWGATCKLPRLGLGVACRGQTLGAGEIKLLRELKLDHLRFDLDPTSGNWQQAFEQACSEARALQTSLHVALHLTGEAIVELEEVYRLASEIDPSISAWLVFRKGEAVTSERWIKMAKSQLQAVAAGALFSTGTNAYFVELNRGFAPTDCADMVSFSVNPQVHAFDDASMVETLETQAQMVLSCQRLAPELQVLVSPITLKPRFNPDARSAEGLDQPGELPPEADPRQHSLFSAAWLLGSVCGLSIPRTCAATYFEATGNLGILETESQSTGGDYPPSERVIAFPTYHVLADLAEFRDREIRVLETESPPSACGLVTVESPHRCLLANLTPKPIQLRLDHIFGRARVRLLDPSTLAEATQKADEFRSNSGEIIEGGQRFDLPPYSYIHIEEQQ